MYFTKYPCLVSKNGIPRHKIVSVYNECMTFYNSNPDVIGPNNSAHDEAKSVVINTFNLSIDDADKMILAS